MTRRTAAGIVFVALILGWLLGWQGAPVVFSAPAAQTTATPTLKPGDRTYTVESGDSVWSIAQKLYGNGYKYTVILQANGLTEASRLRVGQVLLIPSLGDTSPAPSAAATPTLVPTLAPAPTGQAQPKASPTLALTQVVANLPKPTDAPVAAGNPNPIPSPARKAPVAPETTASSTSEVVPSEFASRFATPDFLRVLDILSGILAGSSVVCAFFAYQAYGRAQRLQRMTRVRRRSRAQY